MAAPTLCLWNKFGYCKYSERCRKHHIHETCQNESCDITSCRQRHPNPCKYHRNYRRCKFSPCAFKHENLASNNESSELEIKGISEKIVALDSVISEKNKEIENMSSKIDGTEKKLFESEEKKSTLEKLEEKIKAFEKSFKKLRRK